MNLIECWQQAKERQFIRRTKFDKTIVKDSDCLGIRDQTGCSISPNDLLADDWEIVKEMKKVVFESVNWTSRTTDLHSPFSASVKEKNSGLFDIFDNFKWNKARVKMTLEWEE